MEIVEFQSSKQKANSAPLVRSNKPTTEIVLVSNKQNKSKKKKKSKRAKKGPRDIIGVGVEYYADHIMYPDILGPFRQPRFGASNRTGLGMIKGRYMITGNGTNLIQGVSLASAYDTTNRLNTLTATTSGTAFTFGTAGAPAVVFPALVNVADVNITAASFVVTYLGNPLNVAGEIVIGSSIPLTTGASYDSMYNYPNSTRIPIASLINSPLRAYGRKISERANEFLPVGTVVPDFDSPYLITSSLPAGQVVSIDYTMTWEYRSTTVTTNVIPFDSAGVTQTGLSDMFESAADLISRVVSPVVDALPSFVGRVIQNAGPSISRAALQSASNVGALMTSRYVNNLTNGNYQQRALRYRDEL